MLAALLMVSDLNGTLYLQEDQRFCYRNPFAFECRLPANHWHLEPGHRLTVVSSGELPSGNMSGVASMSFSGSGTLTA
jgi:hypothetical protein